MTSSETNANYGGIAGYAFGIEPLHSSVSIYHYCVPQE